MEKVGGTRKRYKIGFFHPAVDIQLRNFAQSSAMENIFLVVVVILTISEMTLSNSIFRGLRFRFPSSSNTEENYRVPFDRVFFNSDELYRDNRGLVKEPQPLCKEVRTEISSALYVPNLEDAGIYTFRPQKIYMVNCSREVTGLPAEADVRDGCWPHHCREKYVDIDIFGKPKTVKENLWQLMMEIPSVPIACECYKIP